MTRRRTYNNAAPFWFASGAIARHGCAYFILRMYSCYRSDAQLLHGPISVHSKTVTASDWARGLEDRMHFGLASCV